uniref:Uncharacterized protein n=1 Tax=Romanomermis culicivorax TaxID=13658 RepID=A0A915I246_ROMCU
MVMPTMLIFCNADIGNAAYETDNSYEQESGLGHRKTQSEDSNVIYGLAENPKNMKYYLLSTFII